MSIENNNKILNFFEYKSGKKEQVSNIQPDDSKKYFLYEDANQIADYLDTIIKGISNSESLHLSILNQNPSLQLKVKNDSILIGPNGIYVNETSHRFLCSSLINNSNTLKFNKDNDVAHDINNNTNDSLEIDTTGLYDRFFDSRFFRINPPGTEKAGMLTLNIGATNTLIYSPDINRNYC
jgi:hypothetical protein